MRARGACKGYVRGADCLLHKYTHSRGGSPEKRFAPEVGKSVAGWAVKPVAAANVVDLSLLLGSQAVLPVASCSIC